MYDWCYKKNKKSFKNEEIKIRMKVRHETNSFHTQLYITLVIDFCSCMWIYHHYKK